MRIDGLTDHQVAIADRLWEMETEQECLDWIATLDRADMFAALTLMRMMVESFDDERVDAMTEFPEAASMLKSIGV